MQVTNGPPRDALTVAAVEALIRDAEAVTVSAGLELLDPRGVFVDDITDDFQGGSVSRSAYATLHGTARLAVARTLDWGKAIVRPYYVMSDGVTTARFNLGAYFATSPGRSLGFRPVVYDVAGFDILLGLATTVGEAYAVDAGAGYLAEVEKILIARGYSGYIIDQSASTAVLPSSRMWPLEAQTTWLTIINDLLGAVGYQGMWSDWDGRLRGQRYVSPALRSPEWFYDAGPYTSMLADRQIEHDYFNAPNRWVFVRSNNVDGASPVEGDGIYTVQNDVVGETSVEARGGRVITSLVPIDAADQASLVAAAQVTIDADMRVATKLTLATAPNPLHWHFDLVGLDDAEVGPVATVLGTQWTLPLNGANMTHEWSVVTA